MKLLIVFFSILMLEHASARLGETRAQLISRYGNPFSEKLIGSDFFHDDYIIETVGVSDKEVDIITYQKMTSKGCAKAGHTHRSPTCRYSEPSPLTITEVTTLLNQNIAAGGWDRQGPTEWTHKKERKAAFYVKAECRLYVFDTLFCNRGMWETSEEIWAKQKDQLGDDALLIDRLEKWIDRDKWKRIRDAVTSFEVPPQKK